MSERQVEVLVFDGCPNVDTALSRARTAIDATNVRAELRLVRVASNDDARRLRFLGSPSVRVDGVDVDRTAKHRDDFGLQCRIYSVEGRLDGAPPADWIAAALRGEVHDDAAPVTPARGGCCSSGGES
jgi:hypothetical protein